MSGSGPLVVVGGASGCGKTVVGTALAEQLEVPYADGDDFHSEANLARMHAGVPLTDEDRAPWLNAIGGWLAEHEDSGGVVSCSALRRGHRDTLRSHAAVTVFAQLRCDEAVLAERLQARSDHFMPASLLSSQLAILEPLEPDEAGVVLDCARPVGDLVAEFVRWLSEQ